MADVFGLGARLPGMAGAGSALARGPWAAHHAPACLAFARADALSVGVTGLSSGLQAGGEHHHIAHPVGLMAGVSLVRHIEGRIDWSIGVGLVTYVLPDTAAHVIQRAPDAPVFLLYDNRTQRDMLVPALAVGLGRHVALGLSLDVFAGLSGPIAIGQGPAGYVEASAFVDLVTRLRPTPSLVVRPGRGLSFAVTYHPEFSVPYSLDVDLALSGLDMQMQVSGRGLATPHTLVAAAAWTRPPLALALDVSWAMWSRLGSPFVGVRARIQQVGLLPPSAPLVETRDSVSIRAGVEATVLRAPRLSLAVRGGYGWESPVVGEQSGRSNVFDGHKHTLAAGLGTAWDTGSRHVGRILLDLYAGVVIVGGLTHRKVVSDPARGQDDPSLIVDEDPETPGDQIGNPGYPSISGSGWVFTTALTLTVEL
jgi:hypothetical protein